MVFASTPVASLRRFAARPVGAHSKQRSFFARRISRIESTSVVFPTPGPPVITNTRDSSFAVGTVDGQMLENLWGTRVAVDRKFGCLGWAGIQAGDFRALVDTVFAHASVSCPFAACDRHESRWGNDYAVAPRKSSSLLSVTGFHQGTKT